MYHLQVFKVCSSFKALLQCYLLQEGTQDSPGFISLSSLDAQHLVRFASSPPSQPVCGTQLHTEDTVMP